MKKMSKLGGEVRWVFDVSKWTPSSGEWTSALSRLPDDERRRIGRFWFKRDAKASMVGQLLLRKLVRDVLQLADGQFQVARTDKGKPFVVGGFPLSFNVSHQGAYAVLAASEASRRLGVDVMRVDAERFGDSAAKIEEFFHTMRRTFTASEWTAIRRADGPPLLNFYRHWCLKESYVKACGTGIGVDLQAIEFGVVEPRLNAAGAASTGIRVDGVDQSAEWRFEEQLLDDSHCVCVALNSTPTTHRGPLVPFQWMAPVDLMSDSAAVDGDVDPQLGVEFEAKEEEPQYPWKR